jgi:hypothetical protein
LRQLPASAAAVRIGGVHADGQATQVLLALYSRWARCTEFCARLHASNQQQFLRRTRRQRCSWRLDVTPPNTVQPTQHDDEAHPFRIAFTNHTSHQTTGAFGSVCRAPNRASPLVSPRCAWRTLKWISECRLSSSGRGAGAATTLLASIRAWCCSAALLSVSTTVGCGAPSCCSNKELRLNETLVPVPAVVIWQHAARGQRWTYCCCAQVC